MKVLCITATKNRHTHLRKLVRCFIEQDYEGEHTLFILNNAITSLSMGLIPLPPNKQIIVHNRSVSIETNLPYSNLGSIYNDGLKIIEAFGIKPDIVNHMDDDDYYFSDHISKGVEGFKRGGIMAYKPKYSFYRDSKGMEKVSNVLEPSIFVDFTHLRVSGYWDENVRVHHKWLDPLIDTKMIFVDDEGESTFVYDWSQDIETYKTSGNPSLPTNFQDYDKNSYDYGDNQITPADDYVVNYFNNLKAQYYAQRAL